MPTGASRAAVEEQLARILRHPRFVSAERLSSFLRFVVMAELDGDRGRAKEVVIASEVYRRGADYDPQVDSTVRSEASRLRARLREYYDHDGSLDPVIIEIPRGGYSPTFRAAPARETSPPLSEPHQPPRTFPFRSLKVWGAVVIVLAAGVAGTVRFRNTAEAKAVLLERQARQIVPSLSDHLLRAGSVQPDLNLATLLEAAQLFERSTAAAPSRATAWAGLARSYQLAADFDRRYAAPAQAAAARAVQIDPHSAEAHYMDAYLRFFEAWDFAAAERGFGRVLQLNPQWETAYRHYADAASLTGKLDQAAAAIGSGLSVFPQSALLGTAQAMIFYHRGRFDEALRSAADLPPNLDLTHWVRGLALEQKNKPAAAEQAFEQCLAAAPRSLRCAIAIAHLDARRGNVRRAEMRTASLADRDGEIIAARVYLYAGLRDRDRTLEWIARGIAQHDYSIPWISIDPRFAHLRDDDEFQTLQKRITDAR